jgi:hypothetical protein
VTRAVKETNARRWAVVEFDADDIPIWSFGPYDKAEARERFEYVTRKRSQRSEVALRGRSAALLYRGQVVKAEKIRPSRRAPLLENKRLHHLNVETRRALIDLDVVAADLARAGLRADGTPRTQIGWGRVRSVACEIWDLVRGSAASPGQVTGWWLQEWTCGDHQVERTVVKLPAECPYHDAPALREPTFVEHGW